MQVDKVEWVEKCHYASDLLFEWLIFNLLFYSHITLYGEKVTSYEKFSHNLKLVVQIIWKISLF